jgi:heme/copper-type cytochrome/quinol oxidase subunit 3
MTIFLAVLFTYLQVIEYLMRLLALPMVFMVQHFSCYWFSWLHVIVGTLLILVSYFRYNVII